MRRTICGKTYSGNMFASLNQTQQNSEMDLIKHKQSKHT